MRDDGDKSTTGCLCLGAEMCQGETMFILHTDAATPTATLGRCLHLLLLTKLIRLINNQANQVDY